MALTTRLLADPPDVFVSHSDLTFEKKSVEVLFADLYGFMDGPRGIGYDDYFSNIFSAAEIRGGLYLLPIHISIECGFLNTRLMDGIGVDVSEVRELSFDGEIDLYQRVAEAFPDEEILSNPRFSIFQAFTRNRLYDVDNKLVYIDTPEMNERLVRALDMPVDDEVVHFTPERISERIIVTFGSSDDMLEDSNVMVIPMGSNLNRLSAFFLQEHPGIQFSPPVTMVYGGSEGFGFHAYTSLSIMRDAANSGLAWEFVRFIMEFEDSLFLVSDYYSAISHLPINRARFENQVFELIDEIYTTNMFYSNMEQYITMPPEEHKEQSITQIMDYLRNYLEQLNYEIRYNQAVMNSLIYPDIWLLHSGQQDVSRTLANIQSRIELYIYE